MCAELIKLFFGTIFLDELENFPLLLFDMVIDILKESLNLLIEVLVGRLQSREGNIILGAAVLDDILGLVILSVMVGLAESGTISWPAIAQTAGLALPALALWPARLPGPQAWLAVTALGLLCTAVAYVLYFRLIETAGPSRALTVTFAVPVFAIVYGTLFLDEPVTAWMVLCGAVIVGGVALSSGLLRLPALKRELEKL